MDGSTHTPSLEELLGQERWLQTLARRLVRDAATADDLVQETWFRALKARDTASSGSRLPGSVDARSWLGRVLRNVWRERGRSERARAGRETLVARSVALPSARESFERIELQQCLAAHVLELSEPYRSILILRYYEGRSAAEIATRLGEPAPRVRWRLMRARELLRERLDRDPGDWAARFSLFLPLARRSLRPSAVAAGAGGLGGLAMTFKSILALSAGVFLIWTWMRWGAAEPERTSGAFVPEEVALARSKEVLFPPEPVTQPTAAERTAIAATEPAPTSTAAPQDASESTSILGTVRAAEDGRVLEGVDLALFKTGGPKIQARTESGVGGVFRIEDLAPGRYDIAARGVGHAIRKLVDIELVAGQQAELEIELERGFLVDLEVVDRASAVPVPEAEIQLLAGDKDAVGWLWAEQIDFYSLRGSTGSDGRARIGGATRGAWQYVVRAEGHAISLGEALLEPDGDPLRISLERGGAVSGTVLAANGAPVEGARVFLNSILYVKGLSRLSLVQNGRATDARGRYRIEGLPEGVYHAVALLPDGSGSFHFDPQAPGPATLGRITVENAAEVALDFRLPLPGRVHGRVLDPAGRPIVGARVSVSWGDFKPSRAGFFQINKVPGVKESIHHATQTDAQGRFAIDTLRASHRLFKVYVNSSGFLDAELDLEVPPGALLEPSVTLQRLGATIRGHLVDADGQPLVGETVGAFEIEGGQLGDFFQARSAEDGSFELTVPAGSTALHRVYPILHDTNPLSCEPEQREGVLAGATGVDFVLHAKHRLRGHVEDETGTAVRDFVVHGLERKPGSEPAWKALRDANQGEGRFELFLDPDGLIQLRVSAPGCDPTVLTDLEGSAERTVVLRRAADLEGIVVDESGQGQAGVVVALATLDSAIYPLGTEFAPRDTTDSAGRFRLRGVPEAPLVPSGAPSGTPGANRGHLLVCPQREDAPALLHFALPPHGEPARLVLPRSHAVELEFLDASGAPIEGLIVVVDPEGWPLEPTIEAHLADLKTETRGRLAGGRTHMRLLAGPHQVVLVQAAQVRATFSLEVAVPEGLDAAPQEQVFHVPSGG